MKAIELVCVGNLKFKGLREMEAHYLHHINYYVQCGVASVREVRAATNEQVREKEGERMLTVLRERDFVIALDPAGKQMDSPRFAARVGERIAYHAGRLVFLLGGFAGLGRVLEPRIQEKISFSHMTIAHDLFRVVFLEQLYRALTIMHRKTYHR